MKRDNLPERIRSTALAKTLPRKDSTPAPSRKESALPIDKLRGELAKLKFRPAFRSHFLSPELRKPLPFTVLYLAAVVILFGCVRLYAIYSASH